jgi:hypothetical protein
MAFAKKEKEAVTVPQLKTTTIEVKIENMPFSPLVTHGWDPAVIEGLKNIRLGKPAPKKGAKILDADAEYEATRYRFKDGGDGFPAVAFKESMVSACRFIKGLPMTIAKGGFFIEADGMDVLRRKPLVKLTGEPKMQEDIVRVGGAGPGTGAPDLRYRAMFETWTAKLRISFDGGQCSQEMIANLVERAGFHVGIGEDRPEKRGGTNGRFQLVRGKGK